MTKISLKVTSVFVLLGAVAVAPHIDAQPKSGGIVRGRAAYNQHTSAMVTAALVPRGSKLWIWNSKKDESTGFAVTVNDRGPFGRGRVLDLSTGAFKRLYGGLGRGVGPVSYRVMK